MKKLDFKWAVVCGNSDFQRIKDFCTAIGYELAIGYIRAEDMEINTHIINTTCSGDDMIVGRGRLAAHPEIEKTFCSVEDFINAHFKEFQNETSKE